MRNFLAIALALLMCACSPNSKKDAQAQQEQQEASAHNTLVAYFSATGVTKAAAENLNSTVGGTIYEIVPETIYTTADLDWNDVDSRSTVEMKDKDARPAIANLPESLGEYDLIFIGYPIWWNEAPRIINTFIENYDLSGKTLVPFATSGGDDVTNSANVLQDTYPQYTWLEGCLLNNGLDPQWVANSTK